MQWPLSKRVAPARLLQFFQMPRNIRRIGNRLVNMTPMPDARGVFGIAAFICSPMRSRPPRCSAIVRAMNAHFETAAIAIFFAIELDGMDGRIARMTKTQSAFGEQYDSLSDMVSFGAAPALIMYEWVLKGLGRWGWIAAFVYCAGTALRLARFNSNLHALDKRFFQGLPCPAA